jgi:hypothetical protein
MAQPLVRFLGTPDPLPDGLSFAFRAKITDAIGGPDTKGMARLRKITDDGDTFHLVVPKGGNATGVRLLVRARLRDAAPGSVRVAPSLSPAAIAAIPKGSARARMDSRFVLELQVSSNQWKEVFASVPKDFPANPGRPIDLIVAPSANVEIESFAILPLADEIPPPPPEPWKPTSEDQDDSVEQPSAP